jgi:AcrR family transcriptional regulator
MRAKLNARPNGQQRGEETRQRILETAIEMFALEGYEGASTRRLAEEAAVNLPAIQYYFGNKEGLYRAAVAHIIAGIEERLLPIGERVAAALGGGESRRKVLLELLHELLDAFSLLVTGDEKLQSRKLFIARAEIERSAVGDAIHDTMRRQLVEPCTALVAKLTDRPAEDEETLLRTITMLGQISIFCHKGALQLLGWKEFNEDRVRAIQALVRRQTDAALSGAGRVSDARR